jgi:hypothetical protein
MKNFLATNFLLLIFTSLTVGAQEDYKKTAVCKEVFTSGIGWTHTFGKGRCPEGSNMGSSNEIGLGKTQTIVDITRNAQQAVVALGEAYREKKRQSIIDKTRALNNFQHSYIDHTNHFDSEDNFFNLITEENIELSVERGGVLAFLVEGNIQDCYTPEFATNYPYKSGNWFILKDKPLCNLPEEDDDYFYPFYSNELQPTYGTINPVTFDYKKRKDHFKICIKVVQKVACKEKAKLDTDFKKSRGFIYNTESPKKIIILSNFDENSIDFIESIFDFETQNYIETKRTIEINLNATLSFLNYKIQILNIKENNLIYRISQN